MNLDQLEKSKVLMVDDNPQYLKVLLGFLRKFGFEISVAQSGEEALTRLAYFSPDIILLDVMMSGLDGFEICRRIKASESGRDIPVIFMTALTDVDSKVKAFEAGAVDFVTKPIQYREVIARVIAQLSLRRLQQMLREKNEQLRVKNLELEAKNEQLQEALANIKTLRGLLPICANCKQIRDDQGYWHDVAEYVHTHSEAHFTHGICPKCMKKLYPDYYQE
jgi:DNA-binding response OmpR family regulator